MTKTTTLLTLLAMAIAGTAWAASPADTDGDGMLTLDEVQAAFPEIDADSFTVMDANADGMLDEAEVLAAQEAGLMPKTEG